MIGPSIISIIGNFVFSNVKEEVTEVNNYYPEYYVYKGESITLEEDMVINMDIETMGCTKIKGNITYSLNDLEYTG